VPEPRYRCEKLRHYKSLPSVREVLVVSHRSAGVTLHRRGEDGRVTLTARTGETGELAGVGTRVAVDELYAGGLEDAGVRS
jgi:Uma2 family endonuclease